MPLLFNLDNCPAKGVSLICQNEFGPCVSSAEDEICGPLPHAMTAPHKTLIEIEEISNPIGHQDHHTNIGLESKGGDVVAQSTTTKPSGAPTGLPLVAPSTAPTAKLTSLSPTKAQVLTSNSGWQDNGWEGDEGEGSAAGGSVAGASGGTASAGTGCVPGSGGSGSGASGSTGSGCGGDDLGSDDAVERNRTAHPSALPTFTPTSPTAKPTSVPSTPTTKPTCVPTAPTAKPTCTPTAPTAKPTCVPSVVPSMNPTLTPTSPTAKPTAHPTSVSPTVSPTIAVTASPTVLNLPDCVDWVLGYSSISCTATCANVGRTCDGALFSGILTSSAFYTMIASSYYIAGGRPGTATSFCNAGINNWPFATAPAAFAYQVWVSNPSNPSTGQLVAYNYCYYPTTTAQLQGTCDTVYTNPPSQV